AAGPLHNGDGLTYYNGKNELVGLRINRVEDGPGRSRLFPSESIPADLVAGTSLFRNRDQEFERALEKKSAERRIRMRMQFGETPEGFALTLTEEDGISATTSLAHGKEAAQNPERALATLRDNLGKLGNTLFETDDIRLDISAPWFLPASALNGLRREAVERLEAARLAAWRRPPRLMPVAPPVQYPETELSYLANVFNARARAFYHKHGVSLIEDAFEANEVRDEASLMITKHCLRYSFNLCPKEVKGIRPDPMTLMNGKEKLTLRFDCKRCEMHVIGKLKKSVIQASAQPVKFYSQRPGA
ncbi:MAG: DUF3656 domain-containing protein, partial [Zoogloea sp.]|nr:DUF3656 domain-containing protein [Zoogloea sp.]